MLTPLGDDSGRPAQTLLRCETGHESPLIEGIPRLLPRDLAGILVEAYPAYFREHPKLLPAGLVATNRSVHTLRAFGDEWQRFPDIHRIHREIFDWYFEGPRPIEWKGLRVLDAGCGMGRWLHFVREAGADVVGMDLSSAIDVAAARDGGAADFVQGDLRFPPFEAASFDLVYSLGVIHHLEDPVVGVRALGKLVRPGGELRLYVYRSLEHDPLWRRLLLAMVTGVRRVTTQLPFWAVHVASWLLAAVATVAVLWPRRLLRRLGLVNWMQTWPLAQYVDVPFRMLVAEQFDRLVAPIEGRFSREVVESWLCDAGLEVISILPGLGWRAIAKRPG